jgi:class 3 adenylate cyclase
MANMDVKDVELKEQNIDNDADVNSSMSSSHKSNTTNDNGVPDVGSLNNSSGGGSKFSMDESSDLEYMLQNEHLKSGLLGPLERLPLWTKLLLMLITSTIGVLVLGAILMQSEASVIRHNRKIDKSSAAYAGVGNFIHELQTERQVAVVFFSGGQYTAVDFNRQVTATNVQMKSYISILNSHTKYSSLYSKGLKEWKELQVQLDSYRSMIQSHSSQMTSDIVLSSYGDIIASVANFLTSIVNESSGSSVMSFNILVRLKEVLSTTQAFMSVQLGLQSISTDAINTFIGYLGENRGLRKMLEAVASPKVLFTFHKAFPEFNDSLEELQQQIIEDPNNANIGATAWTFVNDIRLIKLHTLETELGEMIGQESRDTLNRSTARITVVICLIVFFWVSSFGSAILFAKTITGPWQRMMKTQENTIKKFVPKGFLRLVKCYKLADLSLGKSVQRDLTVMLADIRNFTALSESMTPSQIFGYLNKYLAFVGPIIRRNAGYIDKFMGDGIMTCFPTMTNGVHTCLLMQDAIDQFNAENPNGPQIKVGIGIHCGPVMVGAIGENERMEGTIISEAVAIIGRLENLTKFFSAKILTTAEAMKRIKNPKSLNYRPLGYVRVKGKEKAGIKVYEIIHKADKYKIETAKKYKNAMDLMIKHDYDKAAAILKDIYEKYPEDIAASRALYSCNRYFNEMNDAIAQLTIEQGLLIEHVRDALGDYAPQERQEAHFKCWVAVYDFRNKAPSCNDKERMQLIKNIMDNYLKPDAQHKIKSERNWHTQVETIIVDYHIRSASPDPNLFNDLSLECEQNMSPAFNRFKRTDEFLSAFKLSLTTPYIHITDDDAL